VLDGVNEPYVFISYSRNDRDFVERLIDGLRSEGINTWTDLENISPGANWKREIERGIFQSAALIYVSSKNSVKSNYMEKELSAFMRGGGRVIPIVIDEDGAYDLPLSLRQIQWGDFRNRRQFELSLHSLIEDIKSLRSSSTIAAQETKSKGYVFVSYADEDSKFVEELKTFMMKQGYAYWDYRESARNYQTDYTMELEREIKNAAATLSVISPYWKSSRDTLKELHFEEVGTPVFLIRLRDPGPTYAIAGMTYIDFTRSRQDGFLKLNSEMKLRGL